MSPRRRPNVLLVMSDQHHAGIMGCAGDRAAITPSLDRLAEEGTRFSNTYCTYPLCAPSRMSFLTGRHPQELCLFDYSDLPPPDDNPHPVNAAKRTRWKIDPPPPRDAQWRTRLAYYGLCSFLDRQVGTIVTALAESGLREHTIIVYCSDHGEMLGEHGLWWKSTFHDGATRVPLIVSWPGSIPAGGVRSENVSLLDLGPTLLDLCAVDAVPGALGDSFRRLLTGGHTAWKNTAIAEHAERGSEVVGRMVRTAGWKLNYYHGMQPELFQIREDPGETNDLSGNARYRDVERRLTERALLDWDPDDIAARMMRRSEELALVGAWEQAAQPPEPDPPWFSEELENWVDSVTAHPP